ncbi:putative bifunctional diguanylate cyclase/phosphodiesterase [Paraburkholderia phenazinium]|uniref:putative bifunctional diguanylate cyclase/phosphodiesterase n=1 Tax=Paraburkholderia phenazinium TaxID=60549 RepID=UPI00158AF8FF|nr:EAL domain-containing protein [Paraburkholderia phenazinium]
MVTDLCTSILFVLCSAACVWRSTQERRRAESALRGFVAKTHTMLASIGEAVIFTGPSGHVEFVNAAAERITGHSATACAGKRLDEALRLVREDNLEPAHLVADQQDGQAENGSPVGMLLLRSDGKEISVEASSVAISDPEGSSDMKGHVLILRNTMREREYIEDLAWQASHDPLTIVMNRTEFELRLHSALETTQDGSRLRCESALMVLDIDRFRIVNDTYGRLAGDSLLQGVGARLEACLQADDVVARLGCDEFGVLLPNCSQQKLQDVSETLRACLSDAVFTWGTQPYTTSASIGVLNMADLETGASAEEALRFADVACHMAKRRGGNRVQLADLQDAELIHQVGEVSWCGRVRRAMESRDFCLYVQPIVEISSDGSPEAHSGCHAELLLRMKVGSSDEGVVEPGLFISAAERYGLMPEIDRWVVRTALERLSCVETPCFAQYAINLSGMSIADERFLDFVREQFSRSGVRPGLICFEITETVAISNFASATRFMHDLSGLGCRFALDDFGSGMSSFGYLKKFPVEYLKIDGSFVIDVVNDPVSCGIVAAINDMGHAMKCKTIAEYVGSPEVLQVLRGLGVDRAQGYYVGRPIPWVETERTC